MNNSFDGVWALISDDIHRSATVQREFLPTRTSAAMGRAIWNWTRNEAHSSWDQVGLDVGTGTGVHSLVMVAGGLGNVMAIDSSESAIDYARERWMRLKGALQTSANSRDAREIRVSYAVASVDQYNDPTSMNLITFNPTVYFDFLNARRESALAKAVYTDEDASGALSIRNNIVYRFFDRIVLPRLAVGGSVFCSWFGLDRRQVSLPGGHRIAHPVEILREWFPSLTIEGDVPHPASFYIHEAQIRTDYGLGARFRENLVSGYRQDLYSRELFSLGDQDIPPTFKFGLLGLVRVAPYPALRFRLVVGVAA